MKTVRIISLACICLSLAFGSLPWQSAEALVVGQPGQQFEQLYANGCEAFDRRQYKMAEQLLQAAVDAAGADNERAMLALDSLEALYDLKQDYAAEEKTLLTTLSLLKSSPKDYSDARIGDTLGKLGAVTSYTGCYAKAKSYQKQAIPILAAACGRTSPEVATCLNNLGWVENKLNEKAAAESHFKQALSIFSKTLGKDDVFYGVTANSLAELYATTNRKEQALPYYRMAVRALTKSLGADDVYVILVTRRYGQALGSKHPNHSPKGTHKLPAKVIPGVC
jgi:tetratricopeptide (TPR) repeat protein